MVPLFRPFPSPVTAMAGTAALGLSRELRTQPVRNRPRTSRRGQVEHKPVAMSPASTRPPRQAHSQRATSCRNKFMIRDRGSNYTAAFDAVLADAGIRTVLCNVQTPRMNAIIERWIGGWPGGALPPAPLPNHPPLPRRLPPDRVPPNHHPPPRALHTPPPPSTPRPP